MTLTTDQLQQLTDRLNERLAEFGELFDHVSAGIVRQAWYVIEEVREEERAQRAPGEIARMHQVFGTKPDRVSDVYGPTGAAIARVGTVTLKGDGTASFDHQGEEVGFRITLDDDESNADRYYRGFNDGYEFVKSGEADAVIKAAQAEGESENEPDKIDDDGWFGEEWPRNSDGDETPPKSDEKLTDTINRHNGVPGWRPGEEFGEPLDSATVATLGPEHTLVTPLKPFGDYPPGDDPKYQSKPVSQVRPIARDDLDTVRDYSEAPRRLPDPDVARENVAKMLATASGGAVEALIGRQPRTVQEPVKLTDRQLKRAVAGEDVGLDESNPDEDDDDELDDDEPGAKRKRRTPSRWEMTPARRAYLDKAKHEQWAAGHAKGKRGNILPTLAQIIAELQRQAMGGVMMPSMAQFDAAKPANWAGASAQMQRLGKGWTDFAKEAGLQERRRGPQPQVA